MFNGQFLVESNQQEPEFDAEPPEELCCPITMDLMDNPHYCKTTEKTYSYSAIAQWLKTRGKDPNNVPLNGKKIEDVLIPDNAMAARIEAFKKRHSKKPQEPVAQPTKEFDGFKRGFLVQSEQTTVAAQTPSEFGGLRRGFLAQQPKAAAKPEPSKPFGGLKKGFFC